MSVEEDTSNQPRSPRAAARREEGWAHPVGKLGLAEEKA